jgi:hypothetical protein
MQVEQGNAQRKSGGKDRGCDRIALARAATTGEYGKGMIFYGLREALEGGGTS